MAKRPAHLDKIETNPIDDVEQLLKEIEDENSARDKDDGEDDSENEGNLTRLVDKI